MRKECLEGEKTFFCRERMKGMKSDFTLNLFKQIAARWIEDLLRFVEN